MEKMRAAVVRTFGAPLEIEERSIPEPRRGELLVQVHASGVCHTDIHAANGDWPVKPTLPFVPGHEVAGRIAAIGPGVSGFHLGDAVGVPWLHDACGGCEYCETGWETLCAHQHNTGYSVDGGYADYVIADADYVGRLPHNVNFEQIAPILCAGVTTYKALKETEARPGQWVVISGIGGLGHIAVQYAKAMGLHVAAVDVSNTKLALAKSLGADAVLNAGDPEFASKIVKETEGGAHGVLVTAPSIPAFRQAIQAARRRSTVSLVGLPPGEFPTPVFDVVLKRITIRGSIVGTRVDLAEAIDFAIEGKVRAQIETEPLEAINNVFSRLSAGKVEGRVVLSF